MCLPDESAQIDFIDERGEMLFLERKQTVGANV